ARASRDKEPLAGFRWGLSSDKRRSENRKRENANHPGSDSLSESPGNPLQGASDRAAGARGALSGLLQKLEQNSVDLVRMCGGHPMRRAGDDFERGVRNDFRR